MDKLYEFCIDSSRVNFPVGVPEVVGDIPLSAIALLQQLNRQMRVDFLTLPAAELQRPAGDFFDGVPWAEGAFLLQLSERGVKIYSSGPQKLCKQLKPRCGKLSAIYRIN